jgi:hypothetical protein
MNDQPTLPELRKAHRQQLARVLSSPEFSRGEKFVIRAQFPGPLCLGNFDQKLWDLLCAADGLKLARPSRAFPEEVAAACEWWHGDLGHRLRAAGLDI